MSFSTISLVPAVLLGMLLAGCGGGSEDPDPTPIGATLVVSQGTNTIFNGTYTTSTVSLAQVEKINPIGNDPEVCSFKFSGLQGPGGAMNGDIRYIPNTNNLHVIFVAIGGIEFRANDTLNAAVNRANNSVDLSNKVLVASTGVASSIRVSGNMPMRLPRPQGC